MKSLNEYIGQELQWIHPNVLSSEYELRAGDEVLARLHWNAAFTSHGHAETADGSWAIERKGIRQTITVLALDTQTELATIEWSGHPPLRRWSRVQVAVYQLLARCLDLGQQRGHASAPCEKRSACTARISRARPP